VPDVVITDAGTSIARLSPSAKKRRRSVSIDAGLQAQARPASNPAATARAADGLPGTEHQASAVQAASAGLAKQDQRSLKVPAALTWPAPVQDGVIMPLAGLSSGSDLKMSAPSSPGLPQRLLLPLAQGANRTPALAWPFALGSAGE